MSDELDDFVGDLQEQIFKETKAVYGDVAFERWLNISNMGDMDNPDGYACITGPCGDTMQIFLEIDKGQVKKASFQTDGCGSSAVCGSFAAEMAVGKNPGELSKITREAILGKLGGLPEEDEHCALLASNTLQEALKDYKNRQGQDG